MLVSLSGCILKLENKKLIVCNMTAGTLFFLRWFYVWRLTSKKEGFGVVCVGNEGVLCTQVRVFGLNKQTTNLLSKGSCIICCLNLLQVSDVSSK